jgi:hypothetical protein
LRVFIYSDKLFDEISISHPIVMALYSRVTCIAMLIEEGAVGVQQKGSSAHCEMGIVAVAQPGTEAASRQRQWSDAGFCTEIFVYRVAGETSGKTGG